MDPNSNLFNLFQPRFVPYAVLIILLTLIIAHLSRRTFAALGTRDAGDIAQIEKR